jgi:hypothetical protein
MKTQIELIELFPFLNNLKLSAQDEAGCAEACLVAADAILRDKKIVKRGEFQAELSKIYLDSLRDENIFGPRDLPSLRRQAEIVLGMNAQIINLSDMETFSLDQRLAIVRLSWANYKNINDEHRYIDDEHYVLVFGESEESIFFWEPSFSFNGKKIFREHLTRHSLARTHLSYSSPFWTMPKGEFIERIKQAKMIRKSNDTILILNIN